MWALYQQKLKSAVTFRACSSCLVNLKVLKMVFLKADFVKERTRVDAE